MFTAEELADIEWLAKLVKAQALSERNAASRLSVAYEDRSFVRVDLAQARSKMERCEKVLAAINRVSGEAE